MSETEKSYQDEKHEAERIRGQVAAWPGPMPTRTPLNQYTDAEIFREYHFRMYLSFGGK